MGYLQGDWIPHPNSLLFNAFPGFWPLKAFWFFRKVSHHTTPSMRSKQTILCIWYLTMNSLFFCFRLASCSCCRTSPRHPRVTPMSRDLASTSAFRSNTEHMLVEHLSTTNFKNCSNNSIDESDRNMWEEKNKKKLSARTWHFQRKPWYGYAACGSLYHYYLQHAVRPGYLKSHC